MQVTALLVVAVACSSKPSPGTSAGGMESAKPAAAQAAFIDRLEQMSATHDELAKGTSPDRLMFAVLVGPDGTISQLQRPVLAAQFAFEKALASVPSSLTLHGPLQIDPSCVLTVQITDPSQTEPMHTVDHFSGDEHDVGARGKVLISVARAQTGTPCVQARLQAARLWALLGENVKTPSAPVRFEAAVVGTRLVRSDIPSLFTKPGSGTWVLLKTLVPDELFFAFDAETGRGEFFPKTPNVPNAAARALFQAL